MGVITGIQGSGGNSPDGFLHIDMKLYWLNYQHIRWTSVLENIRFFDNKVKQTKVQDCVEGDHNSQGAVHSETYNHRA